MTYYGWDAIKPNQTEISSKQNSDLQIILLHDGDSIKKKKEYQRAKTEFFSEYFFIKDNSIVEFFNCKYHFKNICFEAIRDGSKSNGVD